jgi:hypothetical protein
MSDELPVRMCISETGASGTWFQLDSSSVRFITKDAQMGLQDYQCLARGSWARDVAYCLGVRIFSIEQWLC